MTFLVEFSNFFEDNVTDHKISKISTKYCSISRERSLTKKIKSPFGWNPVTHSHLRSVNNLSHSIPMSQNSFKWLIWWIIRVKLFSFIFSRNFHAFALTNSMFFPDLCPSQMRIWWFHRSMDWFSGPKISRRSSALDLWI